MYRIENDQELKGHTSTGRTERDKKRGDKLIVKKRGILLRRCGVAWEERKNYNHQEITRRTDAKNFINKSEISLVISLANFCIKVKTANRTDRITIIEIIWNEQSIWKYLW